jgi:ADP-ribose pyrophosphatase YjhB (NUDIX family)
MPIPDHLAALRRKIGHDLLLVPTIVVIARDHADRLLLVHDRDSGDWTLPGGIMEPGESPADAAVREVWEEARVIADLTHLVGVVGGPGCETQYRNGDRIAWVATIFGARVAEGTPVPDGVETQAAAFFAPDALATLSLRPNTLRFMQAETVRGSGASFEPARWRPA